MSVSVLPPSCVSLFVVQKVLLVAVEGTEAVQVLITDTGTIDDGEGREGDGE